MRPGSTQPNSSWSPAVHTVVRLGIVVGYAVAVAAVAVPILLSDFPFVYALPRGLALAGVAAVAPTLAALAEPRRPLLLLPAGLIGVLSLPALSILGFPMVLVGIGWLWAHNRVATPGRWWQKLAITVLLPVLWIAAFAAVIVHIDPLCVETLTNGSTRVVDATQQGFQRGWVWNVSNTITGSSEGGADVVLSVCTSDEVLPWEAAVSLFLSAAAVGSGWWLAGRLHPD